MIVKFKYGFSFKDILFGWKNKKLYRLPQMIGERFYPLKKCGEWEDGFIVGRMRKSNKQLKDMTIFINFEYQDIKDEDCPF